MGTPNNKLIHFRIRDRIRIASLLFKILIRPKRVSSEKCIKIILDFESGLLTIVKLNNIQAIKIYLSGPKKIIYSI